MRNTFLVVKREYLERVRKKTFIISTLLLPALMFGLIVLPQKLVTMKVGAERHIVVVADNADFAQALQRELATETRDPRAPKSKYKVEVDLNPSESERTVLRAKVTSGEIDGYLWATDRAVAEGKVSYGARETSDFVENAGLERAVQRARIKQQLGVRGITGAEIAQMFKNIDLEVSTIKAGAESKVKGGPMAFMGPFVMVLLLYMTVLLYAVAVLRAVLEEKNSRVNEVLLSSLTAKELMAGKILGVGAVGLTQIVIWIALALTMILPTMGSGMLSGIEITRTAMIGFAVFFALGYLLYSTMYAALGAMVNSEQEAQQWQSFVMMPLIVSIVLMMFIIQHPNSPLSVWGSLIPFFSPILMYVRIVVQTPPLWQIAVSVALLIATIYGMVVLCGRIYRVGILMYGKRPTLPEIMKWLKYA